MIDRILERLEEVRMKYFLTIANGGSAMLDFAYEQIGEAIDKCKATVHEVAKEYGNGWIPVEERLPKDFRGVLITAIALNGTIYTEIGKWNGEQWFHGASNIRIDIAEVIAWMELPAPYQKGEPHE